MTKITITGDEYPLLLLYCGEDRKETIANLQAMKKDLSVDERELRELTESLTGKLRQLSEEEYRALLMLADQML